MIYGYTYRTTNKANGKVYVGQRRSAFDPTYLGSGNQIKRAIRKYGRSVFAVEILGFANSKGELDRMEQRSIIEHRTLLGRDQVYNITPGGEGCGKGPEHPSWGRKAPMQEREIRSLRMTGTGNPMHGVHLCGEKNPNFGKHHSPEAKAKISDAIRKAFQRHNWQKGRVRSPEHCAKISAHRKAYWLAKKGEVQKLP